MPVDVEKLKTYMRGFDDGGDAVLHTLSLSPNIDLILTEIKHQQEISEAIDNAKADAIKAFRPEIERLERQHEADVLICDIQMKSERGTNKLLSERLKAAELLNDFLRNQNSEQAKKLDEAKEIIGLLSFYYRQGCPPIERCLCSHCTLGQRIDEFLEAA
jgi:hypothetical protein